MTSYLIDVNVWLALSSRQHPSHRGAARWFDSVGEARFLICRLTMLGLLRLLTNRAVMDDNPETLAGALAIYDRWMEDPRVELAGEPRGTEELFRKAIAPFLSQPASKAVSDSYLAGFAEAVGANLVTFDKGLYSAAKARRTPCTLVGWTGTERDRLD